MLEIECFGSKRIVCLKYKAQWVGSIKKIIRQLGASLKSYLVYPFIIKENGATKTFFEAIYSSSKVDDLIFDGNDHLYLTKVEALLAREVKYNCIYDCGCGSGSFYQYALKTRIKFDEYVGIDFAIEKSRTKNGIRFIKTDVESFDFEDQYECRLVVLCNVACYLSDDKIENLFGKVAKIGTSLLIVDPVPGLFWDATFDRVKLFYRNPKRMTQVLQKYGYTREALSKDYLLKIGTHYIFPLSYASIYTKI